MNHALRSNYTPQPERNPVLLPPPPQEALTDPLVADAWFKQAVDDAGEILYRDRPGMPRRADHDAQVLAMARAAEPTAKGWILAILNGSGQLAHIADDRDLSDGAARLLYRLAALLDPVRCRQGWFHVTACNETLAQEVNKTVRTIRRYLAELQEAGFIYRHFTTGPIGLRRPAIDLGPLVNRLGELQQSISRRAQYRADVREDRSRCATLTELPILKKTWGEDRLDLPNTEDLEIESDSVIAPEGPVAGVVCGKLQQQNSGQANYQPVGRPNFIPKPQGVLVECPSLAAYISNLNPSWPELIDAAYLLALSWDLNETTWKTLCAKLGREWTAITIAMVAELPGSRFTRSHAPRVELKRASYVAGIARKLSKGDDVSVTASWFRHVKRRILNRKTNQAHN
jgi:Helix-turn-helix domain